MNVPAPDSERRIGFVQGMNATLACLNVLVSLWVGLCSETIVPRFRDLFVQVKVELPVLSVLVVGHHRALSLGVVLATFASGFATVRWSRSRQVLTLNVAGTLLSLGWMALATAACFLPLLTVMEGVGKRP